MPLEANASNNVRPSIYSLYSTRKRNAIVFAASLGVLLQYSASIYRPAMKVMQDELKAAPEVVAATVSIHLLMGGLAALVWGPASDRFGRAPIYAISCVSYVASCLGCMFAPSVEVLLLFRALQGAAVAAFVATASGLCSDIVPPESRGKVAGACMVSAGLGQVLSAPVGGALVEVFGWRSVFVPLAGICILTKVLLLVFMRHETHPYLVLTRLNKDLSPGAAHFQEEEEVMAHPLKFDAPWVPLKYVFELQILPYGLLAIVMTGGLQSLLAELPLILAQEPYNLSAGLIGAALLADGIASVIGALAGGFTSDKLFAARPGSPVSRLTANTLVAVLTWPTGMLAAGWALHAKAHLAIILVGMAFAGFACNFYLPALISYITTIKQSEAAAASGGLQGLMVFVAALVITVGSIAVQGLGFGWWFTILACIQGLSNMFAYSMIVATQRKAQQAAAAVPA